MKKGNATGETSKPLVSVVVPVFNNEKYLAAALESALAQDYRPLEIVVVDDGSTDESFPIAREYADRYPGVIQAHRQAQGGCSMARNAAIVASRGQYIAFLDSDDLWKPRKISRQMEAVAQGATLVTTLTENFWSEEVPEAARHDQMLGTPLPHCASAFLAEREAFLKVGLFDAERKSAEWIEWSLRAAEAGCKVVVVAENLVGRRLHGTNLSRSAATNRLEVLKAHLDRRRAAQA